MTEERSGLLPQGADAAFQELAAYFHSNQAENVGYWQILLKKSFLADERTFSAPLVRPTRGDVRDHTKATVGPRTCPADACSGGNNKNQPSRDFRSR